MRALAAALLAPALALAEEPPSPAAAAPVPAAADAAPAPQGVLTKPPALVEFVEAPYPPEAEAARIEGAVVLEIDIAEDGSVTRAEVVEAAGNGFDEAAAEAVRKFKFTPAEIDGKPAPVRLRYRYGFVLKPAPMPEPAAAAAGEPAPAAAVPKGILRGRVLERGTRDPLKGVEVYVGEGVATASTDGEGAFAAEVPAGKHHIVIPSPQHEKFETDEEVRAGEATEVTFYVRRRAATPYEATVRGQRERKEVARRTLVLEEIKTIPGTYGDALKVIQNLPGVARTPFNFGPPIVRGGRPGDTRNYIDGQLVPLLFHFGGITSVINSDFLQTLDFYPGNMPVRYGRSIAGAIDVTTRAPKKEAWHGYVDADLQDATAFVEGPVGGGSVAASARRSYIDLVLNTALDIYYGGKSALDFRVAPRYWDYQLKLDYPVGQDRFSAFLFGSDDELRFVFTNPADLSVEALGDITSHVAFHRLILEWRRPLNDHWHHHLSLSFAYDQLDTGLGADIKSDLGLRMLTLREEIEWKPFDGLEMTLGADLLTGFFTFAITGPEPPAPGQLFDPLILDKLIHVDDTGRFVQPGVYLEAAWEPVKSLRLVPGVRFDYDSYLGVAWVDPRATLFWEALPGTTLKAGAGSFHQPPSPQRILPKFGNPDLHEEGAWHVSLGVEQRFLDLWSLDVVGYYKWLYDEATRSGTVIERGGDYIRLQYANQGVGQAYGLEVLLKRDLGNGLFGWIAYSLSRVEKKYTTSDTWALASLDQTHNLIALASYKLPYEMEASARVRWTTGRPYTPHIRGVYDADGDLYIPVHADDNSKRIPDFFSLDLRFDKKWTFETWMLALYLDVQNVTNNANPEAVADNYDFTKEALVTGIPIFPSLGIKGEF